jgi:integrase
MAYVVQRGARFTGYYRRKGRRLSAGTYESKREALKQALLAEDADVRAPIEMRLEDYIEQWLPTADCLPITRKGYEAVLKKHVLPRIGEKHVSSITRATVRRLLADLGVDGVGAATIGQCKAALGAAFRPLVESEEVSTNPTHGIKVRRNTQAITHVLEADGFARVSQNLVGGANLFARFLVGSGCRFGEATALTPHDINFSTGEVYVQRRVSEIGKSRNNGQRFLLVDATKSGHKRSLVLSRSLISELQQYIKEHMLGPNDLLFSKGLVLGRGRLDAYLPRDAWRRTWKEAIVKSGIDWQPRTHDLRHANATTLLKNGVDVHEVKERLGHQSIRTTERYLHRLRSQQSKAAEAVGGYLE